MIQHKKYLQLCSLLPAKEFEKGHFTEKRLSFFAGEGAESTSSSGKESKEIQKFNAERSSFLASLDQIKKEGDFQGGQDKDHPTPLKHPNQLEKNVWKERAVFFRDLVKRDLPELKYAKDTDIKASINASRKMLAKLKSQFISGRPDEIATTETEEAKMERKKQNQILLYAKKYISFKSELNALAQGKFDKVAPYYRGASNADKATFQKRAAGLLPRLNNLTKPESTNIEQIDNDQNALEDLMKEFRRIKKRSETQPKTVPPEKPEAPVLKKDVPEIPGTSPKDNGTGTPTHPPEDDEPTPSAPPKEAPEIPGTSPKDNGTGTPTRPPEDDEPAPSAPPKEAPNTPDEPPKDDDKPGTPTRPPE